MKSINLKPLFKCAMINILTNERGTIIMKFFIDTANVEDIKNANELGLICGVTTNPSLIAK